jgi:hypothetical protein
MEADSAAEKGLPSSYFSRFTPLKDPPDFLVAMKRPEYESRFTHWPVVAFLT